MSDVEQWELHNQDPASSSPSYGVTTDERLDAIERKLDDVLGIATRVETLVLSGVNQIKPLMDDLMKSPILKMFGVKK